MKELTIEEKAQRYDEALKVAKGLYAKDAPDSLHLERMFPVLKESEESGDEKMRKSLAAYFAKFKPNDMWDDDFSFGDIVAWFEKQGQTFTKKDVDDAYLKGVCDTKQELEKQGEQKLYVNDNAKEMFIKALERVEEQNNKGYKLTDCDKNSWWEDFKEYTTSEQILANSAKTCKDEQKPTEWSKEDEDVINHLLAICAVVKRYRQQFAGCSQEDITKYQTWLKSLRERYTWKPSDEQINELGKYCPDNTILTSLYEQLKKLTE